MAASRRLRDLQAQPGNRICVDCSQKSPQWASVSYGVFMCLECSGRHRGLGVHISFVRSVTMDAWSEIQLKKMEAGGNEKLNAFLAQYGVPKDTDVVSKYNTRAASVYRDRIQALAEGRPWRDPPIEKESLGFGTKKPPLGPRGDDGWGGWGVDDGVRSSSDMRRNQSTGDFRRGGGQGGPVRSKSTQDIYTKSQLESSAANKESFFSRKLSENESRPEGIPPSQGGKFVGFGSSPPPPSQRNNPQGDVFKDTVSVVSQGFGRLTLAASSAAQSAANVVQAGTKELTSKVRDGGYDSRVDETVNTVTAKTTEIGQRTWGIMKGVMAMASQKVEEYTKEGVNRANDGSARSENSKNNQFEESRHESKGGKASSKGFDSWDDWGLGDKRMEGSGRGAASATADDKGWVGWDDANDDSFDNFHGGGSTKPWTGQNGKTDGAWTGGGFL